MVFLESLLTAHPWVRRSSCHSLFQLHSHKLSTVPNKLNVTNCMMDRVAANHAAILLVNEEWGKILTELNCHLHPLDTVASSVRSALKQLETSKGKLFGNDCVASNIVLQMNKLRFMDGKGDLRGFKAFLESEHSPRGFIP